MQILYSDSFRQACAPSSADPLFLAFSIFVMSFFTVEILANYAANPQYLRTCVFASCAREHCGEPVAARCIVCSTEGAASNTACRFYCWVDIIATLSILINIPALINPIIYSVCAVVAGLHCHCGCLSQPVRALHAASFCVSLCRPMTAMATSSSTRVLPMQPASPHPPPGQHAWRRWGQAAALLHSRRQCLKRSPDRLPHAAAGHQVDAAVSDHQALAHLLQKQVEGGMLRPVWYELLALLRPTESHRGTVVLPGCRERIIDRRTFMEEELAAGQQSRVGAKLTELTIRKVMPARGP